MGKGTDKLYITHSEWSSSDSFSASGGAGLSRSHRDRSFRKLPFNFCAASLQPFKNPVCTPSGTIFDVEVISQWLDKRQTNPVDGEPLNPKDLIKLNFVRNEDGSGDLVDPVTFKVFTDNTHIVAVRHGTYANVFAYDTVERMNIKAKMWLDLLDDTEFTRKDIITLQDPQALGGRDLSQFKYLKDGEEAVATKEQQEMRATGNVNVAALGRIGDKVLRAKVAVENARKQREAGINVNKSTALATTNKTTPAINRMIHDRKKPAANAAVYTTGKAAASFTSTGLTPETSGERALLTDEEYMLKPKMVQHKGYARMETNLGNLNIELHTDTAPRAVWNFTRLAQKGYYRGVSFHRNIPGFMIQGGDPSGTGKGGSSIWNKNFDDEFEGAQTHNARGVLSMANKGKNTNGSQFFITYKATPHLDRKHTIFGRVIEGGGLQPNQPLTRMENAPTDGSDRPLNKITIKDVVIYVDPFEEFQTEKAKKEKEALKAEAIALQGGTDDDKMTWTGKRILSDGNIVDSDTEVRVGKYLKKGKQEAPVVREEVIEQIPWEEPARKKVKSRGGFGNFDGW
ncbi:Peptidyl-prolyl cis-trans isomerase-like 2 [Ceratocystis lukuohia]|uniref:Peptidyl-prolyl cis-trans isomerase-like 2 n=1 Tax=Ceratocystis lukuohia TaxID=2019550 RepID=A0ABR4MD70_9PEZI